MNTETKALRTNIGVRIRELRLERRWTQAKFAKLLGISQNYLSVLERGNGSFTAEQLLTILKHFNIPIDHFAREKSSTGAQIQNALARQGATHLIESDEILPSDRLKSAIAAIREALVSANSSRQIAAIAPVLVAHAGQINLSRLRGEFRELGLENRLNWALESSLEAIRQESAQVLPREWRLRYRRAALLIEAYFVPAFGPQGAAFDSAHPTPPDVLDPEITSAETLKEVSENLPPLAGKWRIVTIIEQDDFVRALRAARDTH